MVYRWRWTLVGLLAVGAVAVACGGSDSAGGDASPTVADGRLLVIATTTQIADMARQVAGERADVTGLLPANADAHDFEPTPRDVEKVADAGLVLEHGMHLDEWASRLVEQSGTAAQVVIVTTGIVGQPAAGGEHDHDEDDPHVWLDVSNAKIMVANIRDALIAADPDGRAIYEANANAYLGELDELDAWIRAQVATIPEANRKLVTNHDAFGYFVHAYGFTFVGSIIPSLDTQAQPSAQEVDKLIDAIEAEGVKAIFTEASLNPDLARRIAEEAGVTVVDDLYADSLGPPGSGAETYIGMMRLNTTRIVEALR